MAGPSLFRAAPPPAEGQRALFPPPESAREAAQAVPLVGQGLPSEVGLGAPRLETAPGKEGVLGVRAAGPPPRPSGLCMVSAQRLGPTLGACGGGGANLVTHKELSDPWARP